MEQYNKYEFVPLRIENAFDPAWWKALGKDFKDIQLVNVNLEGKLSFHPFASDE